MGTPAFGPPIRPPCSQVAGSGTPDDRGEVQRTDADLLSILKRQPAHSAPRRARSVGGLGGSHEHSVQAGGCNRATVLVGGVTPVSASAAVLSNLHFEDSGSEPFTFCEGIDAEVSWDDSVHELVKTRGGDGLVYFSANVRGTTTYTNLDTGKTYTNVYNFTDRDQQVTDNGDGTLRSPSRSRAPTGGTAATGSFSSSLPAPSGSRFWSTTGAPRTNHLTMGRWKDPLSVSRASAERDRRSRLL